MLPALLSQAGFEPNALFATHADYDHLLGRAGVPRAGARRGGRRRWSACAPSPGAASASCATRTRVTTWRAPRRWRSATCSRCPVPGYARAGRPGARAAPRRRPHERRHRAARALRRPAGLRRLPVRRRDPRGSRRAARSTTTAPRSRAWRRWWRRRERVVPGHGRRTTARRRCESSTRTWTTSTRWSAARSARPSRRARDTAAPARDPRRESDPAGINRPVGLKGRAEAADTGGDESSLPPGPARDSGLLPGRDSLCIRAEPPQGEEVERAGGQLDPPAQAEDRREAHDPRQELHQGQAQGHDRVHGRRQARRLGQGGQGQHQDDHRQAADQARRRCSPTRPASSSPPACSCG